MRILAAKEIENAVSELFLRANTSLPEDAQALLENASKTERDPLGRMILEKCVENLGAARRFGIPLCQDTGMAVVFVQIGEDVHISGSLSQAVDSGVRRAYEQGRFRCSVVRDPLYRRENTGDNTPAILYTFPVPGQNVKITVMPKGFGSENMSALKLFTPSAGEEEILDFVCDTVRRAGGNACPPLLVGVGIGGTFEYAALLSKKALLRPATVANPQKEYALLEEKMLRRINALGIGPQGLGGDVTALKVQIEQYPTHIAALPVAVNLCCHAMRREETVL